MYSIYIWVFNLPFKGLFYLADHGLAFGLGIRRPLPIPGEPRPAEVRLAPLFKFLLVVIQIFLFVLGPSLLLQKLKMFGGRHSHIPADIRNKSQSMSLVGV